MLAEPAARTGQVDLEEIFLVHWNSFRTSLPEVVVSHLVRTNVWEALSCKSLRVLDREDGADVW